MVEKLTEYWNLLETGMNYMDWQIVGLIIQIVALAAALLWITRDARKKNISGKIYFFWVLIPVPALFLLGIIGILITVVAYYFWTEYFWKEGSNKD